MKKRIVAIALIAATTACSSTNRNVAVRSVNGETAGNAQDALARGDLLFSRGEHALSLDAYRRALRKDPADPHALNGVAISYAAMGRHDLAREFFELALARAPQDERIHRNFARSLKAQGLPAEAEALLAQLDGTGTLRKTSRPTLAQLAAKGKMTPAISPSRFARADLERVSMGEVRLRTLIAGTAQPAVPGRMIAGLTTAIVTVTDASGSTPAVSLTRELTAPIKNLEAKPAAVKVEPHVRAPAAAPAALPDKTRASAAVSEGGLNCAVRGKGGQGVRLPATGQSITLSTLNHAGDCAGLADGRSFKQPGKRSRSLG